MTPRVVRTPLREHESTQWSKSVANDPFVRQIDPSYAEVMQRERAGLYRVMSPQELDAQPQLRLNGSVAEKDSPRMSVEPLPQAHGQPVLPKIKLAKAIVLTPAEIEFEKVIRESRQVTEEIRDTELQIAKITVAHAKIPASIRHNNPPWKIKGSNYHPDTLARWYRGRNGHFPKNLARRFSWMKEDAMAFALEWTSERVAWMNEVNGAGKFEFGEEDGEKFDGKFDRWQFYKTGTAWHANTKRRVTRLSEAQWNKLPIDPNVELEPEFSDDQIAALTQLAEENIQVRQALRFLKLRSEGATREAIARKMQMTYDQIRTLEKRISQDFHKFSKVLPAS